MDEISGAAGGTLGGLIVGALFSIYQKLREDKQIDEMGNRLNEYIEDVDKELGEFSRELYDHKLSSAQTYVTKNDLKNIIDPMVKSIEILSMKMDNGFIRIEDRLNKQAEK